MKYEKDPVVEDVQKVRKAIFKKCDYDMKKLGEYIAKARQQQKSHKKQKKVA